MIESMHIENFKCFKSFDIELGKFNVLIGPNDSGKTAFLQAAKLLGLAAPGFRLPPHGPDGIEGVLGHQISVTDFWRGSATGLVQIKGRIGGARLPANFEVSNQGNGPFLSQAIRPPRGPIPSDPNWQLDTYNRALAPVAYYRFNPGSLREASLLNRGLAPNGLGFPTFLGKLLTKARPSFLGLERQFLGRFPWYTAVNIETKQVLDVTNPDDVHDGIRRDAYYLTFQNKDGQGVPSESVSDGVILSLAYTAISSDPNPPHVLLVEEPENGVHHASLKDIVGTLRHLSEEKGVQIIATTHSPYLLDLVQPEEVRVFSKDSEGAVHAINMGTVKEIDKMRKHFMTGEIWTSFSEERLVPEGGAKK
jgi:energy-coupling factor transporter ATP-binding protein EcfA2